jgi:ferredoxin
MRLATRFALTALSAAILVSLSLSQQKTQKADKASESKTVSGYLVDKNCGVQIAKKEKQKAMEMAKRHSVACGLDEACMANGYCLIVEGKLIELDDKGNAMAAQHLKGLTKKNDVFVTVTGTTEGSVVRVLKIADGTPPQPGGSSGS